MPAGSMPAGASSQIAAAFDQIGTSPSNLRVSDKHFPARETKKPGLAAGLLISGNVYVR
jgi:hypothetical protein